MGSDDVLAMAFLTFFNSEKPGAVSRYHLLLLRCLGGAVPDPYHQIPLDEQFRIVPEDYFADNGGIVFPNPNAPTGIDLPLTEVERIVRVNPDSVVIVDEAYVDFGAESALPLVRKYEMCWWFRPSQNPVPWRVCGLASALAAKR